jgi:hypothetical protein
MMKKATFQMIAIFSFLTKSSSFVLQLVTATSLFMAACLSPTLPSPAHLLPPLLDL